jgi:hypothetical protein
MILWADSPTAWDASVRIGRLAFTRFLYYHGMLIVGREGGVDQSFRLVLSPVLDFLVGQQNHHVGVGINERIICRS